MFSDRSYPRDHDTRAVAQVQGSSAKDTISQIHDFPRRPGKEDIRITDTSVYLGVPYFNEAGIQIIIVR